ncbi:hypothetical protein GCM10010478_29870 [Streptomyces erythrogriseus]|uniref:Uncharacterized protein n=3 Tax=Streptomyces TaxID=1883 RepID=A0ABN3WT43_9ACTN|nr:hypothetical protein GCM10010265_00230 [Streptomyces griseoincarnatus]GGT74915.1 hypothetical protein GCM10010287_56570 [Streptomyces variabilis]
MAMVVGESATGDAGSQARTTTAVRSQERGRPIFRVYAEDRRPGPEAGAGGPAFSHPESPVTVKDGAS